MKSSVMVLGTKYAIKKLPPDKMPDYFEGLGGFCDPDLRIIYVLDFLKTDEWRDEKIEKIEARERVILRHEIVHAFLNESGLSVEAKPSDGSWAHNEEMVDWIAIQGQKIHKAWQEVGCVD
jgi:hypothetical protein